MDTKIINKPDRFSNTIERMDIDMDVMYTDFLNKYGVIPAKDEPEKISLKRKYFELQTAFYSESNLDRKKTILRDILDIQERLDTLQENDIIEQYGSEDAFMEHIEKLGKLAKRNINHIVK